MKQHPAIKWLAKPKTGNYTAATSYLTLFHKSEKATALVKELKKAPMTSFKAKDIFRASRLPILGISNFHIKENKRKIKAGEPLSPILLVRDPDYARVIIAD